MSNGNDVSGEAAAGEPSRSASAKEQPRNSFDQLRLLAALLVISGHSYPMTSHVAPMFLGRSLHILGVEIFFSISGYLIAESLIRDRNPLRFLAKRALRILPALWLATLVLLVFGLCVTSLTPIAYLTDVKTLAFLKNFVLDIHYALPGVFEDNPQGSVMNGSWWSLPYGTYIYAFAVQQAIVALYRDIDPVVLTLVASPIAVILGTISWRMVERPALALKPYASATPRRLWRRAA